MSPAKSYSVIVVPGDHSGTRQYRVSRRLLGVALVLVLALLGTLVFFVATYSGLLVRAREADALELENAQLRAEVGRVVELSQEIEALSALRAQVLAMLGAEVGDLESDSLDGSTPRTFPLEGADRLTLHQLFAEELRQVKAPRVWPLEGRITREFFHRSESMPTDHPGLDVRGQPGESVVATAEGRVVETGLGEDGAGLLVLDHGFGFRSLYAGLGRLAVREGQRVDQGQVIAYLGEAGSGHAPRLYFEVRVDGEPVDPRQYLDPR